MAKGIRASKLIQSDLREASAGWEGPMALFRNQGPYAISF